MSKYEYVSKLTQPSTWAGIGILLSLFGVDLAPDQAQVFVQGGVGLAGILAIFMNEKGST